MIKTRPGAQLATCIINLPIDDDCTNHPQEDSTKRLTKRKFHSRQIHRYNTLRLFAKSHRNFIFLDYCVSFSRSLSDKKPAGGQTCGFFVLRGLCVDLRSAAEAEAHPPIGVDGHCVNDGQPELIVEIGESIQFLYLEHERTNGFCLGFPSTLCCTELLKLRLCLFESLYKTVVPCGIFFLVLCRL